MYNVDIIFTDGLEYHTAEAESAAFSKYENLFIIEVEDETLVFPTHLISQLAMTEAKK